MNSEIKIVDIGPIAELILPVPEGGGVVCLKGSKGSGKSTALEAVESLVHGGGKLSARDRTTAGTIDGFGVTIRVGRQTRRVGETDVVSLEGRFDVGQIADPGIDNPAAADARRIKAIVAITGVKAAPEPFIDLLGNREDFEAVVSPAALDTDDVIEMAGRIKRDLEKSARSYEDKAEHHSGHAKGLMEGQAELDFSKEQDAKVLQANLEGNISFHSALKSQADSFMKTAERINKAKAELAKAESDYKGPTVDAARKVQVESEKTLAAADASAESARKALEKAQQYLDEKLDILHNAEVAEEHANHIVSMAVSHGVSIETWKIQLAEQSEIEDVPLSQLSEAANAVTEAREAVETGSKLRDALDRRERAKTEAEEANKLRKEAARLRDAAKSTDDVLSKMVNLDVLRVEGGRLVTDTKRGKTFMHELSDGEKAKIAIDIAAANCGTTGLFVVGQRYWQDLPPSDKLDMDRRAKEKNIVIYAAEVDDGELRTELFNEN